MNKLIRSTSSALAAAILLSACEAEFDNPVGGASVSAGSADFTTFVAVGDSLTAGYADGALYRDGQDNSYPAILARQFEKAGGGAFTQPLMPVGGTGSLSITGIGTIPGIIDRLVLAPTGSPTSPAGPASITPAVTTSIDTRVGAGGFNNTGVPGAKSFHLGAAGYGALSAAGIGAGSVNPFFARFSANDGTTVLADALAMNATFFVLWIGNNDILSYATGGGVGVNQTGNADPTTYGSSDITDPGFFGSAGGYPALAGAMAAGGARGVLVNIPAVNTIPYFTTVPFNAIPMTQADADAANAAFAPYNGGVTASIGFDPGSGALTAAEATQRQITFVAGQNPIVIFDEGLTDLTSVPGTGGALVNMRQATAEDFIVLPASSKLGTEAVPNDATTIWGIGSPLLDADVLIASEVTAVETARTAYNATIKATADGSANLLLFDASAALAELNTTGLFYGTGGISSTFATGGGFSLDGVHPTQRGYAVVANLIIDLINDGFGATIPKVDPGSYPTVFYQ